MSAATAIAPPARQAKPLQKQPTKANGRKAKIPDELVRETIAGVKFYYRGYREVMNNTKTIEEIMPDSTFQSSLKTEIGFHLNAKIDTKKYRVLIGETGIHLGHRSNFGLDVAVFDRQILSREKINNSYANVPAELVIEIDIEIELADSSKNLFSNYVLPKTQHLLAFGTKKVVWFFSKNKKVIVATPDSFQTHDWNEDIELMPDVFLNIEKLIADSEI